MSNKHLFDDFESSSLSDWQQKAEKDLKGKALEKINWRTFEGFSIPPYLTSASLINQQNQNLVPGQSPFVRSHKELSNGWLIREEIGSHKNMRATNDKARMAFENGTHNLVFSVKAHDDGFDGIPVENLEKLNQLLDGLDTQQVGLSFKSGDLSPYFAQLLANWVKTQGLESKHVFGGIDYDPIATLSVEGKIHAPFQEVFEGLKSILEKGKQALPLYKQLTIHSRTFSNAGASVVQELAFTLSIAHEYIHQLSELDLDFDTYFDQIQMEMTIGSTYFMEIAKLRAMRWLWTSMTTQYTDKEESRALYLIAKTSEWNKAVYDANVNMLRNTTEGMSAVLGGADEIEIEPFDRGFRKPSAFSERIARNLHHLYTEESHLDKVIDPGAGSYYIESLTDSLAQNAWALFQKVEEKGGYLASIQSGFIQEELTASRKKREERLVTRKEKFIGVNEFPNPKDRATELVEPSKPRVPLPEVNEKDLGLANAFDAENIAAFALHFIKANSNQVEPLKHYVATEVFEQLRAGIEMKMAQGVKVPKVFLMPMGNRAMRSARANFAENFYQVAGLEVLKPHGFDTIDAGMQAYLESEADILVLCSSDDEYENLISLITKSLSKSALRPTLVLAGHPGDKKEDYEDMGVETFIYAGCDVYDVLKNALL